MSKKISIFVDYIYFDIFISEATYSLTTYPGFSLRKKFYHLHGEYPKLEIFPEASHVRIDYYPLKQDPHEKSILKNKITEFHVENDILDKFFPFKKNKFIFNESGLLEFIKEEQSKSMSRKSWYDMLKTAFKKILKFKS